MKNEHVIGAIVIAFVLGLLIGLAGNSPGSEQPIVYEYVFTGSPSGPLEVSTGGTETGAVDPARTLGLAGSPTKGVAMAKVTIVESSDFQ
jgi:hypothetical protein